MGRRLDYVRLAVMMLDGMEIAGRTQVALGISTEGVTCSITGAGVTLRANRVHPDRMHRLPTTALMGGLLPATWPAQPEAHLGTEIDPGTQIWGEVRNL